MALKKISTTKRYQREKPLMRIGLNISDEEIFETLEAIDKNGDGEINFKEVNINE